MDSLLPVPSNNGHDIVAIPDPVTVTISQAAADHVRAWSTDQKVMAIHESSHVVACAALGLVMSSVSIKGHGFGRVEMATTDDDQPSLQLDSTVRRMMVALMAGLAGEIEILGEGTLGNASDIMWATNLAVDRLNNGLDPNYPPIALSSFMDSRPPETLVNLRGRLVVAELNRARSEAKALIKEHSGQVLAFAASLYRARRFDGEALDAAIRAVGLKPAPRGS